MARITHVKKAQQRYERVPVLDEDGQPKRTPVMDRRTGKQKVSKRGPVFMDVTVDDRTKPKPNLRCDFPGCGVGPQPGQIVPGQAYKHITPKSGPYGGTQRNRHEEHPSWNVWEYSSSLSARIAEIESHFDPSQFDNVEDLQSHLDEIAEEIRSLAEEKRESASNIEDGFGHATFASDELNEQADALESWADEVESLEIPEFPESEPQWFFKAPGAEEPEGPFESEEDAQVEVDTHAEESGLDPDDYEVYSDDLDEPTEEQISEWQDEVAGLELGDPGV